MPKAIINGTSLHYHVSGQGVPIIFVHPPILSSKLFTYQYVQLANDFKVVIFDVRGHGESAGSEAPVTYALIAEDIKQLMDHLHIEKAVICGYSFGGQAALEALLTYPDRFLGGILVSVMPKVDDWKTGLKVKAGALAMGWLQKPMQLACSWRNADMQLTYKNLSHSAAHGNSINAEQYHKSGMHYDVTERLDEIKQPVLLMYGEKDPTMHKYAHLMNSRLPNSTLLFLRGMSHHIPTKDPVKMNGLIRSWIQERLHLDREEDVDGIPKWLLEHLASKENNGQQLEMQ